MNSEKLTGEDNILIGFYVMNLEIYYFWLVIVMNFVFKLIFKTLVEN